MTKDRYYVTGVGFYFCLQKVLPKVCRGHYCESNLQPWLVGGSYYTHYVLSSPKVCPYLVVSKPLSLLQTKSPLFFAFKVIDDNDCPIRCMNTTRILLPSPQYFRHLFMLWLLLLDMNYLLVWKAKSMSHSRACWLSKRERGPFLRVYPKAIKKRRLRTAAE